MKNPILLVTRILLIFSFLPLSCQSDGKVNDTPNHKLFVKYFKSYPNVLGAAREPLDEKEKTFMAYSKEKFQEALPGMDRLIQSDPGNDWYWFYKAQTLMGLGRTDDASPLLEKVLAIDTLGRFYEHAHWYLALCYLNDNTKSDKRDALLQTLIDKRMQHARYAVPLLEEITPKKPENK